MILSHLLTKDALDRKAISNNNKPKKLGNSVHAIKIHQTINAVCVPKKRFSPSCQPRVVCLAAPLSHRGLAAHVKWCPLYWSSKMARGNSHFGDRYIIIILYHHRSSTNRGLSWPCVDCHLELPSADKWLGDPISHLALPSARKQCHLPGWEASPLPKSAGTQDIGPVKGPNASRTGKQLVWCAYTHKYIYICPQYPAINISILMILCVFISIFYLFIYLSL